MKKILGIVTLIMIFGVCTATEIRFSPDVWNIGKGCLVAADIIIDTDDKEISATDIIIESSLEFVDFVPTNMFPYFLPPKVSDGLTHLVGFTVDPQYRVKGKASIGTIYMQQKWYNENNGAMKLYFKKKWDTTDSNLSVAGGIDILDTVWSAYYTFTASGACIHNAGEEIVWWIAKKSLRQMLAKLNHNQWIQDTFSRKTLVSFTGLLIIITLLFLYYRISKQWKKQ